MSRSIAAVVLLTSVCIAGATALQSAQQYPVMEAVAQKVIQKYQTASCEDLWAKKLAPTPQQTQKKNEAVQLLRQDPAMRQAFIDKVAGPIVNKMFECGMIP
ncbi:MAG: hypothetical protein ACREF4_02600 [Gammaproteobacteria bacterium]